MLVDVLDEPLRALVEEIGDQASYRVTDVTDETATETLISDMVRQHGGIDVALLNAGIAGELKPFEEYPVESFDRIMSVNVRGTWIGLKYLMKAMTSKGGSIVITASAAGIRATPNMAAYIVSKHAVIGLMRAAAVEGASRGIRVNTVNPATIDTPMVKELSTMRDSADGSREPISRSIPLGRHGEADEVARMMLFLASDESSFCTGGVYMVDGGVSAGRAF